MPSRFVTLDASVLIALSDPDDAHHDQAALFFRSSLFERRLFVHPFNIAEAAVQPSKLGLADRVRGLWDLMGVQVTQVDDDQPWRLASLRASTGLGLPDCCVLDTARQTSSSVATFDARLVRRARDLGVDLAL
jgi:predicted nucleic acid-binding protein